MKQAEGTNEAFLPTSGKRAEPTKAVVTRFYSPVVCSFFLLNMLLGSGPLTLPYAYEKAGFVLGTCFVIFGAFLAYVSATFLIETLTVTNALEILEEQQLAHKEVDPDASLDETKPRGQDSSIYDLNLRFEVGLMGAKYFSPIWSKVVYASLVLYLYGTLAVYAISVPDSLQKIGWGSDNDRGHYSIYCAAFAVIVFPLSFGNFENTTPVQVVVFIVRVTVFLCMIAFAWEYIIKYDDNSTTDPDAPKPASLSDLHLVDMSGIAYVFGNAVLTFNCHHSVPGLVSPVRPQAHLKTVFRSVLVFCCLGLTLLCVLGMLAFHNAVSDKCGTQSGPPCTVNKLYNLNFTSYHIQFFAKLLDAYPVLMVALYPLLSMTLRNNLLALFPRTGINLDPDTRKKAFTLAAALPMLLFSLAKPDIEKVTSITGAYFGCAIMYLIPAFLVRAAQIELAKYPSVVENPHKSEFGGTFWQYLVIGWGTLCMCFSTVNFACEAIPGCSL